MKLLLFNRTSKRDTADFSYTLGSAPQILLASVQRPCLKRSSQQLKERWQVEILTSPLRLVSCSSAQPAAPALGLSAGAGLIPPVTRFAAAGRPASICSTARRAAKRRATRCGDRFCGCARSHARIGPAVDILSAELHGPDLRPSQSPHNFLMDFSSRRPVFWQVLRPARLIFHPDDPGLSASPPPGHGSARTRTISCHDPIQATQPLGLC